MNVSIILGTTYILNNVSIIVINLSNVFTAFNSWFLDHQIEERLRLAGKSHLFTRLSYPGAGHLIEPPYSPSARASMWSVKPKKCELPLQFYITPFMSFTFYCHYYMRSDVSAAVITMWGGHPAPHAAAQEDAWKKMLDYLEKNLRS